MPMCQAGREVPGHQIVTNKLVREESWGEIWRAEHDAHGKVLFVAYTTAEGMGMFQEALPALRRWKDSVTELTERFLQIIEISEDSAIPFVVVRDPGGPSLREIMEAEPDKKPPTTEILRQLLGLSEALASARNMSLLPLGMTPDTIFARRWNNLDLKYLPVAPGAKSQGLLCEGKYTADEVAMAPEPALPNGDTYAFVWLMVCVLAEDEDIPRLPEEIPDHLPLPTLAKELTAVAKPSRGVYLETGSVEVILRRWLRNEGEKELKKYEAQMKKVRKTRSKQLQKLSSGDVKIPAEKGTAQKNGKAAKTKAPAKKKKKSKSRSGPPIMAILMKFLMLFIIVGGVAAGGYFGARALFFAPATNKTPSGTATLFSEALVARDTGTMKSYMADGDEYSVDGLVSFISRMETDNLTSKFSSAMPQSQAVPASREYQGVITLSGEAGDEFAIVTFRMIEQDDGTWRIFRLDWEPLRGGMFSL